MRDEIDYSGKTELKVPNPVAERFRITFASVEMNMLMDNDANDAPSATTVTSVADQRQETVEPSIASTSWPVWTTSSRLGEPGSSARRAWARRFGRLLAADADELARRAEDEIAKPEWETVVAELLPTAAACRWHARRAARILRLVRFATVPGGSSDSRPGPAGSLVGSGSSRPGTTPSSFSAFSWCRRWWRGTGSSSAR